ncbi:Alkaline phosphatase, tissue-nonspecific isozyme [Hypsibius exemplaris]|uniref:Alkaline phosphatase n=1 Tax=Hypsibius exemplaris TaxID=2072580 RepID=A0A1W0XFT9_HYPEX|nr:Alkaline phosphatase, tissue-nonspecific isozyme [Hypsibius exemplaris]
MKANLSLIVLFFILFFNPCQSESPNEWIKIANAELERALKTERIIQRPKNVVFFLGDGMGIATSTGARIYKGQINGRNGEEGSLTFEKFPHVGLSKTYNDDAQVPDSAGSATAFFSGQKAALGVIGLNSNARYGNCSSAQGNHITSILEWAQKAGKATGIVTTTRITHATPAGTYAHTPDRDWETYVNGSDDADRAGCKDIARQLVEDLPGRDIRVIFGGGELHFLPTNETDSWSKNLTGLRQDGRNLIKEWRIRKMAAGHGNRSRTISTGAQLNALNASQTDFVLGLFAPSHLSFDLLRANHTPKQPTIHEMTKKAIEILQKNEDGFFLMIEGGRIDHGHHDNHAKLAFHDTVAFDAAVEVALEMLPDNDTLFVVTSDHSHTIRIGGWPGRGESILKGQGVNMGSDGLPFLTLSYANGPSAANNANGSRRNLTGLATDVDVFQQDALVPLKYETHGGEDVAIYAKGPFAHLFHTLHEQHYIPVAIDYAACYRSTAAQHCNKTTAISAAPPAPMNWPSIIRVLVFCLVFILL